MMSLPYASQRASQRVSDQHGGGVGDSTPTGDTLLVWDGEGAPPAGDWTTVLWRQYADVDSPAIIPIVQLVEQDAEELRACYLAWIHDLGEASIGGKRVVDHLSLRPGFSYWWMSSLAQKFNISGTSPIDDAVKALALERLVAGRKTASMVLITSNHRLAACVRSFCGARGIDFEFRQASVARSERTRRSLYQSLPNSWRALVYLVGYVFRFMPLLLRNKHATFALGGEVTFIDVFTHLDKRAILTGEFISNYWTTLVEKLHEWQIASNWLHLFFRYPDIPSPAQAACRIEQFNRNSNGRQFHALIERSINFRTLATALRDYFTVSRSLARLRGLDAVRVEGSDMDLWPLHADDWGDSLSGREAMVNCLRLAFVENAVNLIPPQRLGIYVAENQPWEMALAHAWKANGHGMLVGVPHTTVRFWDLRYHYDARSYSNEKTNGLPLPDMLAVNGPVARENILAGGYPAERVVEVEALRFIHLLRPKSRNSGSHDAGRELRILACGDFLAETSRRIIEWLRIAAQSLPERTVYVFKPHPAYPLQPTDWRGMKLEISDAPLSDLLAECDVVFTSNVTSAAVDAYCAGVGVIQMLDGHTFNVSPLRGLKGVVYVTSPGQLANALGNAKRSKHEAHELYFWLDGSLPRWRKLLASNTANGGSPAGKHYEVRAGNGAISRHGERS